MIRASSLHLILALLLAISAGTPALAQDTPNVGGIENTATTPQAPAPSPTAPQPANSDRADSEVDPGDAEDDLPNPGDFNEDIARSEIERSLPPLLPAIRLDDAAFVYSGADPEVAAGVAAWRSSLGGSRDRYGNLINEYYVQAQRPDKTPQRLIDFLARFLSGKRLVAVDPGQLNSLTAAQAAQREAEIQRQLEALRNTRLNPQPAGDNTDSVPPTEPGTGTDTGENVPPLDGNGDQGGSSQPPGNDTTGTTGNGTDTGSQGASGFSTDPISEKDLEQRFGITVSEGDKKFTAAELGLANDVLSKLPDGFYANLDLRRTSVIEINGQKDTNIFGVTRTGPNATTLLEISDKSLSDNPGDRIDFPTPPYSTEESKQLQFMGTLAHELTHNFLRFQPGGQFIADQADSPFIGGEDGWAAKFGWSFDASSQKWSLDESRKDERPTNYAAQDNPTEDICESVMLYLYDPGRLKAASQDRYDFIKNRMKIPSVSGPRQSFPPPRDDPRNNFGAKAHAHAGHIH